ncbi:PaaI family thioesterase [Polaromonas sp. P1(28)-13]|nr:PaaI family thioesterase [Polaromonas sp. P1(28)-13]
MNPLLRAPDRSGPLFGVDIPLARLFGLQGEQIGDDRARIRLPYRPEFTNSRGDVHGDAMSVLFDSALACAVRAHDPLHYGVVTIDLVIHFLMPSDGDIIASAHCERRGRSLCFARGDALDAHGRLLAIATGTFKLVERQLAGR